MPTILCIEDEPDLRGILVEELQDSGYETLEAENGRVGLELIAKHKPDLVICDVTMPEMSGYEVLAQLRTRHPEMADMPFLFLTALSSREDIVAGREMGADNYLLKPIDFDVLIATVRSHLSQTARMDEKKQLDISKLCDHIFRVMPHEIRTPLNHIIGFSEMISGETLGPIENKEYVNFAQHVVQSSNKLLRIVVDTLMLADISSGHVTVSKETCDMNTFMRDCMETIHSELGDKANHVSLDVTDGLAKIDTDAVLLEKAVFALASNAIKFSPEGKPVKIVVDAASSGGVRIRFIDKGIGISKEHIVRVFTILGQVENDLCRNFEGLGLGLSLVTQISKLLDMDFVLDSELGTGTTATLTIPAPIK